MSQYRYQYTQNSASGEVTNDEAQYELVAAPGAGRYVNVERIVMSIYTAAAGGGGRIRLQDNEGAEKLTVGADSVREINLEFGEEGWKLDENRGLQAVTFGANRKQASGSILVVYHVTHR